MTINKLIENYMNEYVFSVSTRMRTERFLVLFSDYLSENQVTTTNGLTIALLHDYQRLIMQKTCKADMKHRYLAQVSALLHWAYKHGYCLIDLSGELTPPKVPRESRYVSQRKRRIIEAVTGPLATRDKLILALLIYEGLCPSMIARLELIDLDLQTEEIRLVSQKRFQKLYKDTVRYIRQYLGLTLIPSQKFLFINLRGEKLSAQSIDRIRRRVGL